MLEMILRQVSVLSVQILGVGFLLFLCYYLKVKHDQPLYFTDSYIRVNLMSMWYLFCTQSDCQITDSLRQKMARGGRQG